LLGAEIHGRMDGGLGAIHIGFTLALATRQ
jgi:hypothetical protein